MNNHHFQKEIRRLSSTFGASYFTQERSLLIWDMVKSFTDEFLTQTVTAMLKSSKSAPLPADFEEFVVTEREKQREQEKAVEKDEARRFAGCNFGDEDVRMMTQQIVKRLIGNVDNQHWNGFIEMLNNVPKMYSKPPGCSQCQNTGKICKEMNHAGIQTPGLYIFRCNCYRGEQWKHLGPVPR